MRQNKLADVRGADRPVSFTVGRFSNKLLLLDGYQPSRSILEVCAGRFLDLGLRTGIHAFGKQMKIKSIIPGLLLCATASPAVAETSLLNSLPGNVQKSIEETCAACRKRQC
jgi:hypothetical protein